MRTEAAQNTKAHQAFAEQVPSRRLWIIEVDPTRADIYERTEEGTRWFGSACMQHGSFWLNICTPGARYTLGEAPAIDVSDKATTFLRHFTAWLDMARGKKAFDKAVLVAPGGTIMALEAALTESLEDCVKLAPNELLVKNAGEDRLAEEMYF